MCLFQVWFPWRVCPEVGLLGHKARLIGVPTLSHSSTHLQLNLKKRSRKFLGNLCIYSITTFKVESVNRGNAINTEIS